MRTSGHTVISLVLQLGRLKHKQDSISNQNPTATHCLHRGGTGAEGLPIRRLAPRISLEGQENTERIRTPLSSTMSWSPHLEQTEHSVSHWHHHELPANQVSICAQVTRDRNCSKSVYDHSVVWVVVSV